MIERDCECSADKIAIIGIGCRFPGGACSPEAFWRNLRGGKDCLTETPLDRYAARAMASQDKSKLGRLVAGRGGYIEGFDRFDPAFFGISPREADYMDPQQRKLLQVAWEALEDGGQKPAALAGTDVGVFIGAFTLDYKILQFADLSFETLAAHTATGTMMTLVANRISYIFDFHGPSVAVDTACSSSLVAVHLACQSLRARESSLALAGGTLLHMTPQYTIAETKGGFLSPDGRSRTFDASANGYVRAEGVGVLVLKRLPEALRDGDSIYAVISGSGVNQDGKTNGITVPNPQAQIALIRRVCAEAGVRPGELQYIEAHGTSTPVGDPLEANALGEVLLDGRRPGARCYIGSVKTNIGHTEAAAGVAGMIKTALSLKHRQIPPHINLRDVNPAIDLARWPYEIPTELVPWPEHEGVARAGVNSFGFGGTNAHVLLEEAPAPRSEPRPVAGEGIRPSILPLSARDPSVFPEMAARYRDALAEADEPERALRDVGYTLAHRRQHLEQRLSIVYSSPDDLRAKLERAAAGEADPCLVQGSRAAGDGKLVWVFTGMGPQWWGMGRQLFETEPVYRRVVERCDREMRKLVDWSLVDELCATEAASNMRHTWLAQPANTALQLGLAALWRSWGVKPDAIVGHSTGEVAAFHEAGVYTLEDAIKVTIHRSRLQQLLVGTGTMLAVSLPEAEVLPLLGPWGDAISIGAINSPSSVTLAGDEQALQEFSAQAQERKVFCKFLQVQIPFHSARMDRIKDELVRVLADIAPRKASVPLWVTAGGTRAEGPELDGSYWWRNVRETVRFRDAVDRMLDEGHSLFLEIGPHPVLANAIQECAAAKKASCRVTPSIRRQEDERERLVRSLAELHNAGVAIDWRALYPAGTPVSLPCYPWKDERYWVEPEPVAQIRLHQEDHALLGRRLPGIGPAWEARLDVEQLPYLSDHRIQGNVVFPAAGYVEMAAQAARTLTQGDTFSLTDLEFRKALFLSPSETQLVQLCVDSEAATFKIGSPPRGSGQEAAIHAAGRIRLVQSGPLGPDLDRELLQARAARHLGAAECYELLAKMGYEYGPSFQAIREVWISEDEALARLDAPAGIAGEVANHHVHPSLMDACFQALLTPELLRFQPGTGASGIRLPLAIDEIRTRPVDGQALWVHATLSRSTPQEMVGDLHLYDEAGRPRGRIVGFRAANIEQASARVSNATIDGWLHEVKWIDLPAPEAPAGGEEAAGTWLVFGDDEGLGERLAARLAAKGGRPCLVRPGAQFSMSAGKERATVAPGSDEDMARLLREAREGGDALRGIVHLWCVDAPALDARPARELEASAVARAYGLVVLARAIAASRSHPRLFIVTRGTQAIAPADAVLPMGAAAWGIGRVLWYQELAACRGKLIDLDPSGAGGAHGEPEAEALLRELLRVDEDEIALRGERRLTSRLRRARGLLQSLPSQLRPDGTYLVTGAFGALGRILCRMLVRRGAHRLVLMGRTAVPAREAWETVPADSNPGRSVAFLRELEAAGAQVITAQVDVADEDGLRRWLDGFRAQGHPPIRGVFHSAGVVKDVLLEQMDWRTFASVCSPKLVGSVVLHRCLQQEPLEYFVLFSSVASLMTTAGQTNYAAGNAFLDALAHHRRNLGLPALSIDWGPWAAGMIEELGLTEHYRNARGMSCLAADAGVGVLDRVLGQDLAQVVVSTVVDWKTFLAWYPVPPPLVSEISHVEESASARQGASFVDRFHAAGADERRALVEERFTGLVADALRAKRDRIDHRATLNNLGLDSLMAIELRGRVSKELGVSIPLISLLSGSTVEQLIEQAYSELTALAGQGVGADAGTTVEVFADETQYPLTYNQKAIWFLKQLNPASYAYNIGGAIELHTALDPERMFEAVRVFMRRHPSLRANFFVDDGRPVQRISPELREDFKLIDVQGQDWETVYRRMIEEYRKPYDLETDPLLRFRLFKRAEDRYIVMKAVYHIVSDAISTFTFIEEVLDTYEDLRKGREPTPAPLRARYLDFLNAQNALLASPRAQRMLDYWRGHLPAQIPVLNLPTDKRRPVVQTNNGASYFFRIDPEVTARIHALSQESGATVFMVLLSAYYLLFHKYTAQDDIIIGSPVMGRTDERFANVYGYFVNPLPLHVSFAGDPTYRELLARVQQTVLNGLDHQEYPFALLVEKLGLQHDPSRSAVFQVMFILLVHRVATEKYGYAMDYIELPEEEGQFDITLSVYEDEGEGTFHCAFKYNTDLFLPETIARTATHYLALLDALTRDPARPVSAYEVTTPSERRLLTGAWSGANERAPAGLRVHERIAAAAQQTPDAIAVVAPGEADRPRRLTYRELDAQSNRLAAYLRTQGVARGSVVGICLEKSLELVVAVLAVLKAGAAYLPLDPDYPEDRLAYMGTNAGARLVLCRSGSAERLRWSPGVIAVDRVWDQVTSGPVTPVQAPVEGADLAYVVYTSGSTGRPKGVRVTHENLASAWRGWEREYRLHDAARVHLQMASFSFDVFSGDFVRALCSGGTLVLCPRDITLNVARLYALMVREKVDCAEFVPAVIRGLMMYCECEGLRLDFLRLLVVGSDAWRVEEYARLRSLCGEHTRLVNSYGLSEATIDSTYFEGSVDGLEPGAMVPIGRPFPNSEIYILDGKGRPVPLGLPGELYVGGAGVAAGYAGDPELTRQRFVELALGEGSPVQRLYRTGDLARWDASGCVHLLGRSDTQVKIRGHRVEVGEVEKQLSAHPSVAAAVVVAKEDANGEARLCAFCVPRPGAAIDARALREFLSGRLPTFMLPAHFGAIDEIPLLPSGKIDVHALAAPEGAVHIDESELPRTLFETKVAERWKALLGLEAVGLQQDFFELGGSSIKLIELIHHLQTEFNITISVNQLFKLTTLAGMARTVEDIVTGRSEGSLPYIEFNRGREQTIYCFPPAGGHGIVYRRLAAHMPEYRFVAFNYMDGGDKVVRYTDIVEELQRGAPCVLLGYSLGGNMAFEVGKELEGRGREIDNIIIMDSYRIVESFEFTDEHLAEFEKELREHLRKHTGSEIVHQHTLRQAKEYIQYCSRTRNDGVVSARVSVISDEEKHELYLSGGYGHWQGSSRTLTQVLQGRGRHADMLDDQHVADNAAIARSILREALGVLEEESNV